MDSGMEWPFRPLNSLSREEADRWWDQCYLPGRVGMLGNPPGWRVFVGEPGSGKSVLLAALARRETSQAFILEYPPARWPGGQMVSMVGGNHLAQIMNLASTALREYLFAHPQKAETLLKIHWEFVRWVVEKFNSRRTLQTWLSTLPESLSSQIGQMEFEDIFPSTLHPLDVAGQIDELVSLVRRLGFQYILVISDIHTQDIRPGLETTIKDLFSSLDLMQHPGFVLTASLPDDPRLVTAVTDRSSGRVSVRHLRWEREEVRAIANLHLAAQPDQAAQNLDALVSPGLLARMETILLDQYGDETPQGWVALAETVHSLRQLKGIQLPLGASDEIILVRALFARHMKLRLEEGAQGLRRGPKLITLTEQLLDFVRLLYKHQGKPVHLQNSELYNLVGRKTQNLHALAARTRKQIEPFPDEPIYLLSGRREGGYWLENFI